ncbi:MAG: hypothetical protein HOO86_00235 [Bacteroidales bacterium]|nr:hypothetical protein [Bacteroidales bacterium]
MKSGRIIIFGIVALLLTSCMEKGYVKVCNKVHNAKLESVSWGDFSLSGSLLPGETSEEETIKDYKESFPFSSQLEFYMVADGNRVYLKTKVSYTLDIDDHLVIEINDTTEVINPAR